MKLLIPLLGVSFVLWLWYRRRLLGKVPTIRPMTLAQGMDAGEDWVVVDVRPRAYYEQGWIPGSVNWPLEALASSLERAEAWRGRRIVVVCHSGMGSRSAVRRLMKNGHTDVVILQGGVVGWRKATGGASWLTQETEGKNE